MPQWFCVPKRQFFGFPAKLGAILGVLLAMSLLGGRIPGIFYSYSSMATDGSFASYNNALLLISLSIIPVAT
jgi:hypothetical protein